MASVSTRLGVTTKSLYAWISSYSNPSSERNQMNSQQQEIRELKKELKRVTDERDILIKSAAYFAKESR